MITFENFFLNTEAVFKGCKTPKRKPDYISYNRYTSEESSRYWYGEDKKGKYVIRESNHWVSRRDFERKSLEECSSIATCKWDIKNIKNTSYELVSGKCYLSNFKKR